MHWDFEMKNGCKKAKPKHKIKKLTINIKKVLTNDKHPVIVDLSINVKYLVF